MESFYTDETVLQLEQILQRYYFYYVRYVIGSRMHELILKLHQCYID